MKQEKGVKKGVKKIDKLITGVIVGGAIASIFGISKTKRGKKITNNIKKSSVNIFKKLFNFIGKFVIYVVKIFQKK